MVSEYTSFSGFLMFFPLIVVAIALIWPMRDKKR
jgi:hypothetical protein